MNNENLMLEEILEAREKRARTQRELIDTFKSTLISFTLNIPGPEKTNLMFKKVHKAGISMLKEELNKRNVKILNEMVNFTAAGPEAFFNVKEDAMCIKNITVAIEEKSDLGRLFDFDVFTHSGELTSRKQFNLPERRCLLCNESAKVCGRSRKHQLSDLIKRVYSIIEAYS